ncbi:MAG: 4Fe-4S ferredoxin, iron-sulfur binding domain protein [Actinomycetia bacterium]|nr:4Fe-4S ferredoxin, iron-sulfur binding domain protein [Actinomycetes bacterium]
MGFLLRSSSWPVDWPLAAIVVIAMLYLVGGRMSATQSDAGKRWRGAAFYGGLAILALAVGSPIDAYSGELFWVHMVQHVLLMMVAPPLLLLGRPWPRLSRPLPLGLRRPLARSVLAGPTLGPVRGASRWLAAPLASFTLFNGTLLLWHVPALYDLTLRDGPVHDLEHALFFGTALLFWVHLLPGASGRPQLADGARAVYGIAALLVSWILAIVLGLAQEPLYSAYASLAQRPGGLSALGDQQLAAGVMWVPGSVPYCIVLAVVALRWLDPAAGAGRRRKLAGEH